MSDIVQLPDDLLITVCDSCECVTCWQGEFYCDEYRSAGTAQTSVKRLCEIGREHPSRWEKDPNAIERRKGKAGGRKMSDQAELRAAIRKLTPVQLETLACLSAWFRCDESQLHWATLAALERRGLIHLDPWRWRLTMEAEAAWREWCAEREAGVDG